MKIFIQIKIRPKHLKAFLKGRMVPAASNTVHNSDAVEVFLDINMVDIKIIEDGPFAGEVFYIYIPVADEEKRKDESEATPQVQKEKQEKVS